MMDLEPPELAIAYVGKEGFGRRKGHLRGVAGMWTCGMWVCRESLVGQPAARVLIQSGER